MFLLAWSCTSSRLVYLSVNYLCFYSYLLGKDITIVIKFTDITVSDIFVYIVMK